jgi:hypothetical protein
MTCDSQNMSCQVKSIMATTWTGSIEAFDAPRREQGGSVEGFNSASSRRRKQINSLILNAF